MFHLTAFHPKTPLNEGFGNLKILKSPKERRLILEKNNKLISRIERTLFTVFCPFCGVPINFRIQEAFLAHVKIVHHEEIRRLLSIKSESFDASELPQRLPSLPTSSSKRASDEDNSSSSEESSEDNSENELDITATLKESGKYFFYLVNLLI